MCKISYIILFPILLIVLSFRDNSKANDQFEKQNVHKDGQNQRARNENENGNGWMNNVINMGINSAKNIANFVEVIWKNAQNKIDIQIHAKVSNEIEKDMKKIGEIMKKILEIDVNVKIDLMKNWIEKNDGIVIKMKLFNRQTGDEENRQIKMAKLFDKDGKMEMNSVELGKELIRQICGGNYCDQPNDLPEFGANPWSTKPPPELHELDRSLRPMLLKLASKLNKGRLWTDNPMPDYKNGFYVAFDWEVESNLNSNYLPLLKAQLERFERNAPIRFLELQNSNMGSSKFKNRLHFVIYEGR